MCRADDSYPCSSENSIVNFVIISVGAIVGANLRYLLSRYAAKALGPVFPYGTLLINILGSFIVGWFMIWTSERVLADPRWRLLLVIGFCGGFTTFSSFAFESMAYFEQGQWRLMATNIVANNLLCLAAALAGMALARIDDAQYAIRLERAKVDMERARAGLAVRELELAAATRAMERAKPAVASGNPQLSAPRERLRCHCHARRRWVLRTSSG